MENEKRLIDANALSDAVAERLHDNPHPQGMIRVNHRNEHNHFLRMILDAPTVDAVEVVHGRNIGDEECDEWYRPICQCSICRGYWMMPQNEDAHFCPVCGAKMDGGNEDV